MARIYLILSVIGWGWTALVAAVLPIALARKREPRGFEVVEERK
jgi:hypothetical protein